MKEHALFLLAGFPAGETAFRKKADWFREEFEDGLRCTVQLSNGVVGEAVLNSGEIVTKFTLKAEHQTSKLAGIPIDMQITEAEKRLRAGCPVNLSREMVQRVRFLNRRMLQLLNGLIEFKERILREVTECELIETADGFAVDYCRLLEEAKEQDAKASDELLRRTLETTEEYQKFKTAGTEGITGCQIRSIILPLLADHVLREANHYLRILETGEKGRNSYGTM